MTFSFANHNKRISRFSGQSDSGSATEVIRWFQFNGASLDHPAAIVTESNRPEQTSRHEKQFSSLMTHRIS